MKNILLKVLAVLGVITLVDKIYNKGYNEGIKEVTDVKENTIQKKEEKKTKKSK